MPRILGGSGQQRTVLIALGLGALAVLAFCVALVGVQHAEGAQRAEMLSADDYISAGQAGLLGRVSSSHENVVGDLAMMKKAQLQAVKAKAKAHKAAQPTQHKAVHPEAGEAKQLQSKAAKLEAARSKLQAQERKVNNLLAVDNAKYHKVVAAEAKLKATPKLAKQASAQSNVAKEVASMVISTLEPQLSAEQKEIAKLDHKVEAPKKAKKQAAKETPKKSKEQAQTQAKKAKKETYQPAFPAHWHNPASLGRSEAEPVKKHSRFQKQLSKFIGSTGVKNVVEGHQKKLADYKMETGYEEPGAGAEPEEEPEWEHEEAKSSPCSVSGKCNHGRFTLQDPEYWREHSLERWRKEDEDGNGNKVEGGDEEGDDEEEGDENDDEEKEDGEEVRLGNEVLMRSLDDFVTPNDAYIHNLLTSGAYGIDHFGKLAPTSRENEQLMYGATTSPVMKRSVFGKELHPPGKGGPALTESDGEDDEDEGDDDEEKEEEEEEEERAELGDDVIGDDDHEVPVKLSTPPVPGEDFDHFDHWKHDSAQNQELLNGIYWKRLKKDGMMDRLMPADEAMAQKIGDSHDRHPLPDLMFGSWNQGFGMGSTKKEPSPFIRARKETHGEEWADKTFTGTHENIEDEKGVVGNMVHDNAYFKQDTKRPTLRRLPRKH